MRNGMLLWLFTSTLLLLCAGTSAAQAAPAKRPVSFTFDLGTYRGYWRIENALGVEVAHDECFIQRVCREAVKGLTEGDYVFVLSNEPQSLPIRFKLLPGSLTITSGASLAVADGMTLRLVGLRRVVVDAAGYRGGWSLDLWKGAEATGFFKRDGSAQTIELFPDTTYTLNAGPFAVERFQIGRDDRIVLIDDTGAVRVAPSEANRLVMQTIDSVLYPLPQTDSAAWVLDGLPPADGRMTYTGARILRLLQGAKYRLSNAAATTPKEEVAFSTGKACNMVQQSLKLGAMTVSLLPISVSCSGEIKSPPAAQDGALRRNIAP